MCPAVGAVKEAPIVRSLSDASLARCIHCGLCLEACPTYRETFDEARSSRGRLALVRGLLNGEIAEEEAAGLLDECLLCRSCEDACPSGVAYGQILEALRARRGPGERPWLAFLLRFVFPRLWLLRTAVRLILLAARMGLAGVAVRTLFPQRERAHFLLLVDSLKSQVQAERGSGTAGEVSASPGRAGMTVALFEGCIAPVLYPFVLEALRGVVEALGFTDVIPAGQGCCGALHQHFGDLKTARRLAQRNIEAFEALPEGTPIVVEAPGCAAALAAYPELFDPSDPFRKRAETFAARVRTAAVFLAEHVSVLQGALARGRQAQADRSRLVVYQDHCHESHVLHAAWAARDVLARLPGISFRDPEEADLCCGSAGIYNLLHPSMAHALGERKADALAATGASTAVVSNPGCRLQLESRLRRRGLRVVHLVELVFDALREGQELVAQNAGSASGIEGEKDEW